MSRVRSYRTWMPSPVSRVQHTLKLPDNCFCGGLVGPVPARPPSRVEDTRSGSCYASEAIARAAGTFLASVLTVLARG